MEASVSKILRRHFSRIALACFVFLAAAIVAQFAAALVLAVVAPALLAKSWFLTGMSFVCLYVVGFPFFILVLPKAPPELPEKERLGGVGEFFICLLMAMGILYPLNLLSSWLTQVLGGLLGGSGTSLLDAYLGNMDLWAVALFAVILSPIMEELVFRKLIMDRIRTIDRPAAILFSALVFGLFHGNLGQFFYAFGVGLLFGAIYARTGRLRYTILLHVLVNAIGSLVPMLLLGDVDEAGLRELLSRGTEALPELLENLPGLLSLGTYYLVILCCTVAGIILLIRRLPRLARRGPEDRLSSPGRAFLTLFVNGGFIALLLASALEMVLSLLIT